MQLSLQDIARLRLRNQWITAPQRSDAAAVVDHLVAVQAQDFPGAKWALGLRLQATAEPAIERAFNEGRILRTHVLRPTWHFVTPRDIRWLLDLTGPRIQAANAGMHRRMGLDAHIFRRAEPVLRKALRGRSLVRDELRTALNAAGISTQAEFSLASILMQAEVTGLICSGPRRGRQFTYALLDERVPPARKRSREDSLAELARRYFASRGPATVHDMAKWSGLTLADCRAGLESVKPGLQTEILDGQEYWFVHSSSLRLVSPKAHLLSVYDEYLSSYRGNTVIAPPEINARLRALGNALSGVALIDGFVIGTWKRTATGDGMHVTLDLFNPLTRAQRAAIVSAAESYAAFHGLKARVS